MATYQRAVTFDFAIEALRELRDDCRTHGHDIGDDEAGWCDCRLGWHKGELYFREGDASGDTAHYEHCAAASVSWDMTEAVLREVARGLCDLIEESICDSL